MLLCDSYLQGNLGNHEFKERSLLLDSTGSGDHRETSRAVRAHSHSFPGDSQAFKTGFSCCLSYMLAHKCVLRVIECFTFIDAIFISSLIILKLDFITSVK